MGSAQKWIQIKITSGRILNLTINLYCRFPYLKKTGRRGRGFETIFGSAPISRGLSAHSCLKRCISYSKATFWGEVVWGRYDFTRLLCKNSAVGYGMMCDMSSACLSGSSFKRSQAARSSKAMPLRPGPYGGGGQVCDSLIVRCQVKCCVQNTITSKTYNVMRIYIYKL